MSFSYPIKKQKTEKQIKQILSEIFHFQVRDVRITQSYFSIIAVELSSDFHQAKVYYSILEEERKEMVEKILHRMGGFILGKLKPRLKTKTLPRLRFIYKKSSESEEVIDLIEKLNQGLN